MSHITSRKWFGGISILFVMMAIFLAACHRGEKATLDRHSPWSALIAGYTHGIVSRKSEIRVLFTSDVTSEGATDARKIMMVDPAVEGDVQFRGARELALVPGKDLEPGKSYTVTLLPKGLKGIAPDEAPFVFTFRVQTPQFDVAIQNLESDANTDERMTLRGTVTTADNEDAAKVERLLTVSYVDGTRQPTWTHSGDGLTHTFTVTGLARQNEVKNAVVKWDGKPIGSANTGELQAPVPALGAFVVTEVTAQEDAGNRQIRVYFSDTLDSRQNLRGLVRMSQGDFTTRVENNVLILYPNAELNGDVTINIESQIANAHGARLGSAYARTLTFTSEKPQVRFVGNGVILPDGKVQSIPFEVVNARAVHVTATRIFDNNMTQFLQVNRLNTGSELGRVGRYMWRKTIALPGPVTGRWTRYSLDMGELLKQNPGGMFQIALQLTPADSAYKCANTDDKELAANKELPELANQEDGDHIMPSSWDYAESYYGYDGDEEGDYQSRWNDRQSPCKTAYFTYDGRVRSQRNVLGSNIGLLAKQDQQGKLLITVTDLRTAQPMSGVTLSVRNFQNQVIGKANSDASGFATLEPSGTPFLLVADHDDQHGYLKLNAGNALPISQFDTGGETVTKGLKGILYGERGVWRPGDDIHLTLVVQDKQKTLPANHPATLELSDPRGRVVQTLANTKPVGGFYRFDLKTAADAPTGNWNAKVMLGGVAFSKALKIETVMPNRLKIALDMGKGELITGKTLKGSIAAQWLTGATAKGLKTDVKLRLTPTSTKFNRFTDYVFDDPAREFSTAPEDIYDGELDASGNARFTKELALQSEAPGMLTANFTTRVFERGGAFSISHDSMTYAPYSRFVGVRLPAGDVARGMLQTDQDHMIDIGSLNARGEPVALSNLRVTLYKVEWRWWWDKIGDSLAQYVQNRSDSVVSEETISTGSDGHGQWKLRINYPQWGRYLLRVCDQEGGHCSGKAFYIDWPAWAGKEREQNGTAASMLSITADKARYQVGDTATLQLPESAQGRALVTVESGSAILESRWLQPKPGNTRFTLPITATMAPNVYVAVTLVQPHEDKNNDRPIRLYGVIPIEVNDPKTHLTPVLKAADEWQPESHGTIEVSESKGRAMTYTVAVVDEGLLSLTSFKTPNLYEHFFKREALGIKTWDLFDDVVGAYGAELEKLLALGGSDAGKNNDDSQSKSRFPPVVTVLGPFQLAAGATAKHQIELPRYVGAVRVMVVAGDTSNAAYGSVEKSVYVRQPLMILPTLPRVVGPGEEIAVPVSVFVMDKSIHNVSLKMEPDTLFTPVGDNTTQVAFSQPDEKLGILRLKAANRLGKSHVKFIANSGKHSALSDIYIDVRGSNPPTTHMQSHLLQPGETWTTTVVPHGMEGTNKTTLEVAGIMPLNLEQRLGYLIQYPHGCLEQTTSSVFPQLYLPVLMKLDDRSKQQVEDNIRAGIERLRWFQLGNGGFSYWPGGSGGFATGSLEGYAVWATTYASHFLVEAEKAGYAIPPSMRGGMIRHLKTTAQSWNSNGGASLDQAYRLYVLARAGEPEVGAMNRLRETSGLATTERWLLASAYELAGLHDVAMSTMPRDAMAVREYKSTDYTFGSVLRDHAIALQSMVMLKQLDRSQDLVKSISDELSSERWYATQSVAYALLSMGELTGAGNNTPFSFERTVAGKTLNVSSSTALYQSELTGVPVAGQTVTLRNTSQRVLFATVANRGVAAIDVEDAESSGLTMTVRYENDAGEEIDVSHVAQGTDVTVQMDVRNNSGLSLDNIALTQIVPAGWEIRNDRMEGTAATGNRIEQHDAFDGSRENTRPKVDYVDIRDDRIMQYFSLRSGDSIHFTTRINAAYRGRFYLPSIAAEAMYDASKHARTKGMWTEVIASQ